uniref:Peroxisomal membrane protein PEX14 n=1 Tax=Elaeophora elaphi TaxID=1147741 RepID=A0A0R3RVP4_9BILA
MDDDQKEKTSDEKDTKVTGSEERPVGIIRPEMVDIARRFMMIPKIRQTPLMQQKRFLIQKGLREDEINEAMKGLPLQQDMWHINNTSMEHAVTLDSSHDFSTRLLGINTWFRLTKYAMIISSFSYASWHMVRSYILPRFFNIPEPVDERIYLIEKKINEMQGMVGDVTTELLLKLQTVLDKQSLADRFSLQSGTTTLLDDLKKSVESITKILANKEPQSNRILARKRNAIDSLVFPRTEESGISDIYNNEHSEETSVSVETLMSVRERNDSAEAEKSVSNSDF